jgi:hypothetical protein
MRSSGFVHAAGDRHPLAAAARDGDDRRRRRAGARADWSQAHRALLDVAMAIGAASLLTEGDRRKLAVLGARP